MTTTMFPPPEVEPGVLTDVELDEPPYGSVDLDADPTAPPGRARRRWSPFRSPPGEPRWARPALLCLLAATGVLYIWGLGASGWANSFYSAAAQAGSQSWKAFFFGSSDAANFITVDKPPAALWFMSLSIRIFGLNSWSILVPEALMGVASVGVLYTTVRRWFGSAAGLIAGAVLALTPVATLMFRFNNPDALLVLVLIGGAYCVTRALEAGSTKWLSLGFALVGFGFLTKMLQALLVLPAFGLVYLIAGPTRFRKRVVQLVVATAAFVAAAGWWVAIVELVPASMRPYVGGSTNNSVLNLIFGYNGFGRLTGNETGSVGGGGAGGTGQWGPTGWLRMFNSEFGGQASWLIPAALVLLGTVLVATWRAPRTDKTRAAMILWGGWLIVTAATFSLGQGIIHPYYTVALAPAIGAVVGIGGVALWKRRNQPLARIALATTVGVSGWWAVVLLRRTPSWNAWLQPLVIVTAIVGIAGILLADRLGRRLATVAVAATLVAGLAGPTAYSLATAASNHNGAIPSAGPSVGRGGFGGGPGGAGGRPNFGGGNGGPPTGGFGGGQPPAFGDTTGTGTTGTGTTGTGTTGTGIRNGGGIGGILGSSTPSAALTTLLETNADQYTWVAATVGANQAAGYQLATQDPVMAIGGFNGTDQWPTLAAFQQYVAQGKIHYFIAGGSGGGPGGNSGTTSTSSQITSWVESHFTATTVGGTTVYDLTATPSA